MMLSRCMKRAALVCGLVAIWGCSGKGVGNVPKTIPATAIVTYKGQPVEGATVSFVATGTGVSASAVTDATGKAVLRAGPNISGVAPGSYTVTISKVSIETVPNPKDPDGPPLRTEKKFAVPERYGDPKTSNLKAEVSEGGNREFTFELTD